MPKDDELKRVVLRVTEERKAKIDQVLAARRVKAQTVLDMLLDQWMEHGHYVAAAPDAQPTPELGLSSSQEQLSLAHTILPALEAAEQALDNALSHVRATAAQAVANRQPTEDGVVPRKTTRRRKA